MSTIRLLDKLHVGENHDADKRSLVAHLEATEV